MQDHHCSFTLWAKSPLLETYLLLERHACTQWASLCLFGVWARKVCGKPTESFPGSSPRFFCSGHCSKAGDSLPSLGVLPVFNSNTECKRKKHQWPTRTSWCKTVHPPRQDGREHQREPWDPSHVAFLLYKDISKHTLGAYLSTLSE